jgi:8-oxo-dGTP diphosphatase
MHSTQRYILQKLQRCSPRRYSELRPKEVEGNVFMHHLRKLIRDGVVVQVEGGYGLTSRGNQLLDRMSASELRPRVQPKILVEVACQREDGAWLFFRRKWEPFKGKVGFPAGNLHLGESVLEAAARELKDKTGLEANLTHLGNLYMTTLQDGDIISHLLTHVVVGKITGGEFISHSEQGEAFWHSESEELPEGSFPGLKDVIAHIKKLPKDGQFFGEYSYNL